MNLKRRLSSLATMSLCAIALLFAPANVPAKDGDLVGTLKTTKKAVFKNGKPAKNGDEIRNGDVIENKSDRIVVVELYRDAKFLIWPNTKVKILDADQLRSILIVGRVEVVVGKKLRDELLSGPVDYPKVDQDQGWLATLLGLTYSNAAAGIDGNSTWPSSFGGGGSSGTSASTAGLGGPVSGSNP